MIISQARMTLTAAFARMHFHGDAGVQNQKSRRTESYLGILITFVWLSAIIPLVMAQDGDATSSKAENSESREEARNRIDSLTAVETVNGTIQSLKASKDPILVFSDPTRKESAGTVWAIGTEGRPKAILSLFSISGESIWSYEFTALSSQPLSVGKGQKWAWKPKKSGMTIRELEIKAPAANTPAARLSQMKLITRDFSASEVYLDGTRIDLRLLPRPLLRYSDESQGIIDGALFAFANGTNPEILLVIESTKGTGSPSGWQYGAARMSSAELHLQFKDVEVWTIEGSRRESVDDPYYSRRE